MKNIIFFFLLFINSFSFANTVIIEGNTKLSIDDIQQLSEIDIFSNDFVDSKVDQLINDLYTSDLIEDITLKKINNSYILNISENKLINKIFINGNIFIQDEDIISLLNSKDNTLLDRNKLLDDVNLIKNLYSSKGFNQINITTVTEKFSEDRLNLIFDIVEGQKSYIGKIRINGNSFFSQNFLLSKINSESKSFLNIFGKASNLSDELFNFDINILENLYKEKGFFDVKIRYLIEKSSLNSFNLDFFINENKRYEIKDIIYDNDSKFDQIINFKKINNEFFKELQKNDFFYDDQIINDYTILLNQSLLDQDIFDVKISDNFDLNKNNLIFSQKKNEISTVNKINIYGNKITKDKVIRSKLDIEPGDALIEELLEKNLKSLRELKFINDVSFNNNIINRSSDLDIIIDENLKTGSLFFAATGSSDLGLGLSFGINDANILGSGNQLNTNFSINSERFIFDISAIHYPYSNSKIRNNYSISNTQTDYSDSFGFKANEQKFSLGLTFDYSQKISMSSGISYKSIDGNSPKFLNDTAINDNIGLNNDITLNYSIYYDSTNNYLYPSDGFYNSLSLELSPKDISDNSYLKSVATNKNYFEISDGGSFLFNINRLGYIDSLNSEKIRTFNAFSLGGSSFNGFGYRGIGPKNSNNIYLGGNKYFTSTLGIGTNFFNQQNDNFYIKLFLSTGSIWDSDYSNEKFNQRSSIGSSLDFLTPIGPISISYAIPIDKSSNDQERRFDFRIGGFF